jgi:hypothetical protein
VTAFKSNGLQDRSVSKQSFGITNTDYKLGYNWALYKDYNRPYMFISAQAGDEYHNIYPFASQPDGEYVLVVHINPPDSSGVRPVTESNYDNNVSRLGFRVIGGVPYTDSSIVAKTKPVPPTGLNGVYHGRNEKKVYLDWNCPYHEPYVRHFFRVTKMEFDGRVTIFNTNDSEFVDEVRGNFRGAQYSVETFIPGLGYSRPETFTVYR